LLGCDTTSLLSAIAFNIPTTYLPLPHTRRYAACTLYLYPILALQHRTYACPRDADCNTRGNATCLPLCRLHRTHAACTHARLLHTQHCPFPGGQRGAEFCRCKTVFVRLDADSLDGFMVVRPAYFITCRRHPASIPS